MTRRRFSTNPTSIYQCVLCKRVFVRPMPHICYMGDLKHMRLAARKRGLETIWVKLEKNPYIKPEVQK